MWGYNLNTLTVLCTTSTTTTLNIPLVQSLNILATLYTTTNFTTFKSPIDHILNILTKLYTMSKTTTLRIPIDHRSNPSCIDTYTHLTKSSILYFTIHILSQVVVPLMGSNVKLLACHNVEIRFKFYAKTWQRIPHSMSNRYILS